MKRQPELSMDYGGSMGHSLDMANVLLQIEEKFNIKIPDEDVEQLDSINSIVAYIQEA